MIVTEGGITEPMYFKSFSTRLKNIDIRVVPNSKKGSKTDYMNLLKKAIEQRDNADLSEDDGDTVWIVADGDTNLQVPGSLEAKNKMLASARKQAAKEHIHLLISNPCFEFWFLLHRQYTTKFLEDYAAVKQELEHVGITDYEKNRDVYTLLLPDMNRALINADRVLQHHLDTRVKAPFGLEVNPFTEVGSLVRNLVQETV